MVNTVPLRKNSDFMRVYKKGRYYAGKYMVLYVLANKAGKIRLGISVSKKLGKSVTRNRIRRLIRENYRLREVNVTAGIDLVFNARKTENFPTYDIIDREMTYLIRKLGVMNPENNEC
jgi:ribonuclease P protein component